MAVDRMLSLSPSLDGYVTVMQAIAGKSAVEIENALGFSPGALKNGFYVLALDAPIVAAEVEWKDRTMYSDGWHFDRTIGEYVQRQDELRAHLGRLNNYDESKTDANLGELLQRHVERLNVRDGPDKIVKVIPKSKPIEYPDSDSRSTPQWRLRVRKPFVRIADVPAGGSVPHFRGIPK